MDNTKKSLLVDVDGRAIAAAGSGADMGHLEHQKAFVIFALELPPEARGAHPILIERALRDPRNAATILKGIAVQATRQLGKYPVDQRLVREVVRATSPAPRGH